MSFDVIVWNVADKQYIIMCVCVDVHAVCRADIVRTDVARTLNMDYLINRKVQWMCRACISDSDGAHSTLYHVHSASTHIVLFERAPTPSRLTSLCLVVQIMLSYIRNIEFLYCGGGGFMWITYFTIYSKNVALREPSNMQAFRRLSSIRLTIYVNI